MIGCVGRDLLHCAQNIEPLATGQHQIQEQQIVRSLGGHLPADVAAGGFEHAVAGEPQSIDNAAANRRIVFDGQNGLLLHWAGVSK